MEFGVKNRPMLKAKLKGILIVDSRQGRDVC